MKTTAMSEGSQLCRVIHSFQSLLISLVTWLSFIPRLFFIENQRSSSLIGPKNMCDFFIHRKIRVDTISKKQH